MREELSAWTPLAYTGEDGAFTVSVFGRDYRFDHSFLPTSVTVRGEELLDAPIALHAAFTDGSHPWIDFSFFLNEADEEHAEVLTQATCGNIIANATLTFAFDGLITVELRLSNFWQYHKEKRARLCALSLEIPLRAPHATLFHYWPNDRTSIIPSGVVMNSGAWADAALPFKPYLWGGDEYRGLGFFCETDRGFELTDPDSCVTLETGDGRRTLTVRLLDGMPAAWAQQGEDRWVDTLPPLLYTFGFQATPVKAFPQDMSDTYRRYHTSMEEIAASPADWLEQVAAAGTHWLILHENWTAVQNWGRPADEQAIIDLIARAHALGLRVMVYFGYEYSTAAPDFNRMAHKYLIKNRAGNFTGGWQRMPAQRAFMVCYNGGYADVLLQRVCRAMDVYGADGIYTDGTYVPWECANEEHGCGWRDSEGRLHPTFPILAVRRTVQRLYKEVHRRGGIIDTHQSSCCLMPTLSFADSYYDGENIQEAMKNPDFLNPAAFRCEYMGLNMGIPDNFICYGDFARVAGLSLLHNVFPRPCRFHMLAPAAELWRIYEENDLDHCRWRPYFEENGITAPDRVYASAYDGADYRVVVVTAFRVGVEHAEIDFGGAYQTALDLQSGEVYPLRDGRGTLPVEYLCAKLYRVR